MSKILWSINGLLVIFILMANPSPVDSSQSQDLDLGVVKLVVTKPDGNHRIGGGFIVHLDAEWAYVLTAAHVFEWGGETNAYFSTRPFGKPVPVTVIHTSHTDSLDLALLKLAADAARSAGAQTLPLSESKELKKGTLVQLIGHRIGAGDWSTLTGWIANRSAGTFRIQTAVDDRSSGGPVLLDGKVVGIVVKDETGIAIAKTTRHIRLYLEDHGLTPDVWAELKREERKPFQPFRDCDECPEVVVIPSGTFQMGSTKHEDGHSSVENPMRRVKIDNPFVIATREITFNQWKVCVWEGGCSQEPNDQGWGRGRRPVINVSWNDTQEYVKWLSGKTGKAYRLPSEAEWEYAARAREARARFWGDDPDAACRYANVNDETSIRQNIRHETPHKCNDGYAKTAPVGSFEANKFGLLDMLGNVWEWTADCWNESYEGAPDDGRAWKEGDCTQAVLRGGSWHNRPDLTRSATRNKLKVKMGHPTVGFRPVRDR